VISIFIGVSDRLKDLGFVVMSNGYYQLYVFDLSPRTSIVVEGFFCEQQNKYLYDFYSLKFDKCKNLTYGLKIYCDHVGVASMYKKVENHVHFLKGLVKK
jgi:hypothetical protein